MRKNSQVLINAVSDSLVRPPPQRDGKYSSVSRNSRSSLTRPGTTRHRKIVDEDRENKSQYSLNHQCLWRKSYEEEFAKRIETHTLYQQCLQKLDQETLRRKEVEQQLRQLNNQLHLLQQTLKGYQQDKADAEGSIHQSTQRQTSQSNLIRQASISSHNTKLQERKSVSRNKITNKDLPVKVSTNKHNTIFSRNHQVKSRYKLPQSFSATQSIDFEGKQQQRNHHSIQQFSLTQERFNPNPLRRATSIDQQPYDNGRSSQVSGTSQERLRSKIRKSDNSSNRQSIFQAPMLPSHERKIMPFNQVPSSNTRLSTYQGRKSSESRVLQLQTFSKNDDESVIIMTRDSLNQTRNSLQLPPYQQSVNAMTQEPGDQDSCLIKQNENSKRPLDQPQEFGSRVGSLLQEQITQILSTKVNQNRGFGKLRIFSFDGMGKAEKVLLNQDPIRIAQDMYRQGNQKKGKIHQRDIPLAQSMNYCQFANGQGHLQYQSIEGLNYSQNQMFNNEEDVVDNHEDNKTPAHGYEFEMSIKGNRRMESRFHEEESYSQQDLVTPLNR